MIVFLPVLLSGNRRHRLSISTSSHLWPATKEQIREAMQFVPDELILNITATGTPEEAKARVEEYKARGCTCPVLYPLGDPLLMMDTFGE